MKLRGYSIFLVCLLAHGTSAAEPFLEFGNEPGGEMSMTYQPSSAPLVNTMSPAVVTLAPIVTKNPTIAPTKAPTTAASKTLAPIVTASPIQPTILPTTTPSPSSTTLAPDLSTIGPTTGTAPSSVPFSLVPTILASATPTALPLQPTKAPTSLAPVGAVPTHYPMAEACIPQNVSGSPFKDIGLSFAVETFDDTTRTTADFLDALSQGLLAAVVEESTSLCLAALGSRQEPTLGRRHLLPTEDLGGVTSVQVTGIGISDTETCVASTDGATCQVVDATLRVYGETADDSELGGIAVGAVLRSKLEQGGLVLVGEDILAIREYQVDQPLMDAQNDGESSGGLKSGAITATIVVVSGLVGLSIALVLLHKRLSKRDQHDEKLDAAADGSHDKCNESYITMDLASAFTIDQ
jgi:hypothetical protein